MTTITSAFNQYATRPADERYDSLQSMIDAAADDRLHSKERNYNLKDLTADVVQGTPDRLVLGSSKGSAEMSHWAFGQLCRTVGAPASYLRSIPAGLARDCVNFGIGDSPTGTAVNLLVRGQNGKPPLIRACTSDSYKRVWDDVLYSAIGDQIAGRQSTQHGTWDLPPVWGGGKAGAYRGDRDSFLILVNGGSIVTDPSLQGGPADGGAMYRAIMVRNSEVGACAVMIEEILYRYICGNHMLWGAIVDRKFRRRHVGEKTLRDTMRVIGEIAYQWADRSAARDEAIIRSLIANDLATTRDAVIDELMTIGATKAQAVAMYDTCEAKETASPRSFWGLAQGATRVSQESQYQDERYQLDRLAAVVLARGAKLVTV